MARRSSQRRGTMRSGWMDTLKSAHLNAADVTGHFFRGCIGKKSFPSKKQALGVKRAMLAETRSYDDYLDTEKLEAYKCRDCGRHHLGHPPKQRGERRDTATA